MPIPLGYSRSTVYGHLPGGEVFNWSLWANEAPADQAATQAQATSWANAISTLMTTPGAGNTSPHMLMSNDAGYDGVRVYSYSDASGRAQYIADAPIGKSGGQTAGTYLPNQCALVCTLKTGVAGRRATGRIYLPITRWNVSAGGQLVSADVTGIANWMAQLLHNLNGTIGSQHVGVLSQKYSQFNSANAVVVDTRVDVQRRRANRQVATSKATAVIA